LSLPRTVQAPSGARNGCLREQRCWNCSTTHSRHARRLNARSLPCSTLLNPLRCCEENEVKRIPWRDNCFVYVQWSRSNAHCTCRCCRGTLIKVTRIDGCRGESVATCSRQVMEEFSSTIAPKARDHGLVMRQLSDETLIYDLEHDRAHCLSMVAGLVWNYCDGLTSIAEMAQRLSTDGHKTVDETTVWQALGELDEAKLLEPAAEKVGRVMSRRDMVATMGVALSVPLISSLIIPTAAMAATPNSCTHIGSSGCTTSPTNSCCFFGTGVPQQAICLNGTCCTQVDSGFACSSDTQCCASYCVGGTCVSCRPSGTPSSSASQCCSLTLFKGLCCTASGNGNANVCSSNAQCCSGKCNLNATTPHCVG
jgi:hypothetical protein